MTNKDVENQDNSACAWDITDFYKSLPQSQIPNLEI